MNSFDYKKDKAKAIVKYKGYTIMVFNYLDGLSTFDNNGKLVKYGVDIPINYETSSNNYYEIWKNGKCLHNTLYNDDKMWTINSAIISAKKTIDLNGTNKTW